LKSDAPQEELERFAPRPPILYTTATDVFFRTRAKEHARNNGGIIRHEYSLIKGFTYVATVYALSLRPPRLHAATPAAIGPADIESRSVEYPDDQVQVLESTEHLHIEQDGEVRTQS
jgi:hypothetical protein